MSRKCSVCESPLIVTINQLLIEGKSVWFIERHIEKRVTAYSIERHRDAEHHLKNTEVVQILPDETLQKSLDHAKTMLQKAHESTDPKKLKDAHSAFQAAKKSFDDDLNAKKLHQQTESVAKHQESRGNDDLGRPSVEWLDKLVVRIRKANQKFYPNTQKVPPDVLERLAIQYLKDSENVI